MEHTEILKQIGLTQIESKVYLTALNLGECLAGKIANRAKLHRRNVYDALEKLLEMGLVSCIIKKGKKYWTATNPERLKELMLEKVSIINNILPDLKTRFNKVKSKENVRLFLGFGGIKTFFNDILKEKKDLYVIGATGNIYSKLPYFAPNWIRNLNKLKVELYYLLNYDVKRKKQHFKDLKNAKIKILPKNFKTATQIFMYGNKSCIVVWSDEPIAVLIESEKVTKGFMQYFRFMWNLSNTE